MPRSTRSSSPQVVRVVAGDDPRKPELVEAYRERGMLVELGEGRFGLPGFVDIHVHAPQWPQAALALDEPLYLWLSRAALHRCSLE